MTSLNNLMFDSGLNYGQTNATEIYINSQLPTTHAEATSTYALGSVAVGTKDVADGGTGGGRQLNLGAVTGGSVTGTDTASHASLTGGGVLIATTTIGNPQAVTSGQTFDLTSWFIQYRDPTSV